MSIARDMARLRDRDPGFLCSYCAVPLALPFPQTGPGQHEWEQAGWELILLPDGEGVWQVADERRLAHRDHVHPSSKGGSDDIGNLVLSCDSCNLAKKAMPLVLFLATRAGVPRFKSLGGNHLAAFSKAWAA